MVLFLLPWFFRLVVRSGAELDLDALQFLERPDLKRPDLKGDDRYHFLAGKAHDFALGEAFKAVDSGPEYTRAMEAYGKLMGVNNSMETLFQMGMSGYKGEDFVKLARTLAKDMDKALFDLKQREPDIKYLIESFKDASKTATDPDAKKGLDARVKQLEDMLKMIPGTNGGKNDERYDTTKEMCRLINSADFNSESFLKWFKDNGPVLIWTTIAVAGILAMPFSGGASGVLTAIAVSALVATVSYGAVEAYKELIYQGGGSAQGSDFWRATLEAVTGDKYIQQNIRYDPKTGKFKAPPSMQETFETALKQIGKDTALNLIGAGFGKLLSIGAKALPASKLAATELAADAKVIVEGLNKAAAKSGVAASTYGGRFTKVFFESLPLGVVGATTGAIIQDELKTIKDNRELVEFAGHAANLCMMVLFHRVGGHLMQPKMLRNGAMEIPYDKNAFLEAMKQEYGKAGKPMPEYKIEGETVKFSVGGKVMELRFVDPAKVAAELDAKGVKPKPLLPGEKTSTTDGSPAKPAAEKITPETKPVQDLWTALIADAPKTNHGELLAKVRECKFTPDEINGLTKLARRDGPEIVNRLLKLPPEARSAALNDLIRTGASAENLRIPLQSAEVQNGISKMDSSYHKAMTELASTPEGLDLARRVLALPEDIVKENSKPENLTSKEVLAILNKSEIAHVERLELQARGGKPPLKESDILKPDELARYKAIKEQQDALGKKPLEMEDAEIARRVDGYLKGEGHAKESLPPDGVVKKGKTLHIVLGAPGAGKSKSIVEGLQKDYGARLIDSDLIKPDLPGYKGGLGTQIVHPVSDKIATAVRNKAYAEGENIVQPVIGRTYEGIHAMIRQARANGYDVAIHLADIPPETSVRRVYDRGYAKDPVEGGVQQVIPLSYPLEFVGHRPSIVFDYLVKTPGLIDAYTKYNTNSFPATLVDKSPRQLPTFKPGSPGAPPPASTPPPTKTPPPPPPPPAR